LTGAPNVVDCRKEANPHAARHRGQDWTECVHATPEMKSKTNVRKLVTHVVQSGLARRKGTPLEDEPWHFFHDALSLMTSSETKDWMESKGWLKRWTLPHHDLNKHIPHCSNPRPIGNNMRAQPMDHTMNEDHDDCVLRQVAATCLLPNDDPRKFSLATPNLCASACTRVHDANGISSF